MSQAAIIIGLDPGKHNFGVAVVRFRHNRAPKLLTTFLLRESVQSLLHEDFHQACDLLRRSMRQLLREHRPKRVIIERFLNRGRFFGGLTELVSVMIGIIWSVGRQLRVPVVLTTAAAWKNKFQRERQVKLADIYKAVKPLPPHCLDAALLAVYGYSRQYNYGELNLQRFLRRERQRWQRGKPA